MNELQSSENGTDATAHDESDSNESKRRCVALEARIQNIQIQVSNANGEKLEYEGVDCVKLNLVDEVLLEKAKRETMQLQTTNAKLTQELKLLKIMLATQNEEIKGLKAQVKLHLGIIH